MKMVDIGQGGFRLSNSTIIKQELVAPTTLRFPADGRTRQLPSHCSFRVQAVLVEPDEAYLAARREGRPDADARYLCLRIGSELRPIDRPVSELRDAWWQLYGGAGNSDGMCGIIEALDRIDPAKMPAALLSSPAQVWQEMLDRLNTLTEALTKAKAAAFPAVAQASVLVERYQAFRVCVGPGPYMHRPPEDDRLPGEATAECISEPGPRGFPVVRLVGTMKSPPGA